jgi:hypothetical protein
MQHRGHSQFDEEIGLRFDTHPKFWGIPVSPENRDKGDRSKQ